MGSNFYLTALQRVRVAFTTVLFNVAMINSLSNYFFFVLLGEELKVISIGCCLSLEKSLKQAHFACSVSPYLSPSFSAVCLCLSLSHLLLLIYKI